jgi:hypothetical protein
MAVLDRFKDTDKYPRRLREKFATLIGLREEKALFLKKEEMDRCGWHGDVTDFPNASEEEYEFGDATVKDGIMFRTPRLIMLRGAHNTDPTFLENSEKDPVTKKDKVTIMGFYEDAKYLWDNWKEANKDSGKSSPFRVRRIMLVYLVNKDGKPAHSKPLVLSLGGGAQKNFVEKYSQFLEQLESCYAKATGDTNAEGFGEKMCASVIWTPTFGITKYGGFDAKVLSPNKWVEPTPSTIASFWPKKEEDIDNYENIYECFPVEAYGKNFFKQMQEEVGINALAPGVDISSSPVLPAADSLGTRDETGALVGGLT